jgi:5-methylcytosine-specific restriction endonuclease McrA
MRYEVMSRDGDRCVYCGREKGQTYPTESKTAGYMTLDHVIPESKGGATSPDNLVTCCNSCNGLKANRTPEQAGMEWPLDVTGKRYGLLTREEKRREEKRSTPSVSPEEKEQVQRVFVFWKKLFHLGDAVTLTKERSRKVLTRVRDCGLEKIEACLRGWASDPWRHEDPQRYELVTLLKSATQVEKGVAKGGTMKPKDGLDLWMEQKDKEERDVP